MGKPRRSKPVRGRAKEARASKKGKASREKKALAGRFPETLADAFDQAHDENAREDGEKIGSRSALEIALAAAQAFGEASEILYFAARSSQAHGTADREGSAEKVSRREWAEAFARFADAFTAWGAENPVEYASVLKCADDYARSLALERSGESEKQREEERKRIAQKLYN